MSRMRASEVSDSVLEALRLVRRYNVGLDTTLTWTLLGMWRPQKRTEMG